MSDIDMFDIPQDENEIGAALQPLRDNCAEAIELDEEIKSMEELSKSMRSRLHELRTKIIPDLMGEAGVGDTFSTADGYLIKLSQFVMGGLPKDGEGGDDVLDDGPSAREIAIAELIRLGGEGLIKQEVAAHFAKGEYDMAMQAKAALEAVGIIAEVEESIHAGSYKAFAKEVFNSGADVSLKKLGVEIMPQAKITKPKAK